jgi:hypothetical protein
MFKPSSRFTLAMRLVPPHQAAPSFVYALGVSLTLVAEPLFGWAKVFAAPAQRSPIVASNSHPTSMLKMMRRDSS